MEESGPPLPPPPGKDWQQYIEEYRPDRESAVDLTALRAGDRLSVETKNTRYDLTWQPDGTIELMTNQPNRPYGQVQLEGCVFGLAETIVPGVLFCGGKLEYFSDRGHRRHRTTSICRLTVIRAES